jgi:hypothetical protein
MERAGRFHKRQISGLPGQATCGSSSVGWLQRDLVNKTSEGLEFARRGAQGLFRVPNQAANSFLLAN